MNKDLCDIASAQKLKLQLGIGIIIVSSLSTRLLARYEVLRLTEADRSKRPIVHSVSIKSPISGPPCKLDSNAYTREEESSTFIKNGSVGNQIN